MKITILRDSSKMAEAWQEASKSINNTKYRFPIYRFHRKDSGKQLLFFTSEFRSGTQ